MSLSISGSLLLGKAILIKTGDAIQVLIEKNVSFKDLSRTYLHLRTTFQLLIRLVPATDPCKAFISGYNHASSQLAVSLLHQTLQELYKCAF